MPPDNPTGRNPFPNGSRPRRGPTPFAVACGTVHWPDRTIPPRGIFLLVGLLPVVVAAADGSFSSRLSPAEFRSAGLEKLTVEELARLDQLASRAPAPAPSTIPTTPDRPNSSPTWMSALVTLGRSLASPGRAEVLECRLVGDFSGWRGRTTFRLDNGQLWTQVNATDQHLYSPTLKSPKARIYPATFGTFWLEVDGVNERCRIKPVKLE